MLAVRTCNAYRKSIVGRLIWISKWLLKRTGGEQNGVLASFAVDQNMRRHDGRNYIPAGFRSR
jgi:hypothetical protein